MPSSAGSAVVVLATTMMGIGTCACLRIGRTGYCEFCSSDEPQVCSSFAFGIASKHCGQLHARQEGGGGAGRPPPPPAQHDHRGYLCFLIDRARASEEKKRRRSWSLEKGFEAVIIRSR
jgi:hypothetical protein